MFLERSIFPQCDNFNALTVNYVTHRIIEMNNIGGLQDPVDGLCMPTHTGGLSTAEVKEELKNRYIG